MKSKKQVSPYDVVKKQAQRTISYTLWIMLLKKHFKYSPEILDKLSKIRMNGDGEMKTGSKAYKYATKHFPSLLKRFEEWRDK